MKARRFWGVIAGNWLVGGIVFAVCIVSALVAGILSPALYQATALFQVSQLADLGSDAMGWNVTYGVFVRLNSDVPEKWLARADMLEAIIARAGTGNRVTASQLHRHVEVIPAGDNGLYEATVWSPSRTDAPRLADATAAVVGDQTALLIRQQRMVLVSRLRGTLANLRRFMTEQAASADSERPGDGSGPSGLARAQQQAAVNTYTRLMEDLTALDAEYRANPVRTAMLQPAGPPVARVTPGPLLYLLFGAAGGAVLGLTTTLIAGALRGTTDIR